MSGAHNVPNGVFKGLFAAEKVNAQKLREPFAGSLIWQMNKTPNQHRVLEEAKPFVFAKALTEGRFIVTFYCVWGSIC